MIAWSSATSTRSGAARSSTLISRMCCSFRSTKKAPRSQMTPEGNSAFARPQLGDRPATTVLAAAEVRKLACASARCCRVAYRSATVADSSSLDARCTARPRCRPRFLWTPKSADVATAAHLATTPRRPHLDRTKGGPEMDMLYNFEYAAVRYVLTAPQIAHRAAPYLRDGDFDFAGLGEESETMSNGESLLVRIARELWLAEKT